MIWKRIFSASLFVLACLTSFQFLNVRDLAAQSVGSYRDGDSTKPRHQYEPSLFRRGEAFDAGETPLTRLAKKRAAGTTPMPDPNWEGGYGWVFTRYIPSPFETEWKIAATPIQDDIKNRPLCRKLHNVRFKEEFAKYTSNLHRFPPDNAAGLAACSLPATGPYVTIDGAGGGGHSTPLAFDNEIFSSFEYEFRCTRPPCHSKPPAGSPPIGTTTRSSIEPLVGILRHPDACSRKPAPMRTIINKNYMLVDPWPLRHSSRSSISPKPRVLFFDAGASTWERGSGGASQTWFHSVYRAFCIDFSDWFMWEKSKHDPEQVFSKLPGFIRPGYRWYNIPLTVDADSWDNPINHLLLEARKEDIVIVKIDFDVPILETALIRFILNNPEVSELIDELYFEHHIRTERMYRSWKTGNDSSNHTGSVELFTAMRQRGIRAHSWV